MKNAPEGQALPGPGIFGKDSKIPRKVKHFLIFLFFGPMLDFRLGICYNTGVFNERKEKR